MLSEYIVFFVIVIIFAGIGIATGKSVYNALRDGKIRVRTKIYTKESKPVVYWGQITIEILIIILVFYYIAARTIAILLL